MERLEKEKQKLREQRKEERKQHKEDMKKKKDEEMKKKILNQRLARFGNVILPSAVRDKVKPIKIEHRGKEIKKVPIKVKTESTFGDKSIRSPICCILGHVDTGKTKLLDKIRETNVQDREAGGITQQIGASYFPYETLLSKTEKLRTQYKNLNIKVPGLLIIDTPGHESFTNLRSRGSSLCDIAILVVDIMHGIEPQTVESIKLLKMKKTPFIVALNKVDRLLDWKVKDGAPIKETLKNQPEHTQSELESRINNIMVQFAENGLNTKLYWKNKNFKKYISLIPTSAHTGEGVPDLLMLLTQLTHKFMQNKLHYEDRTECTVLEVKVEEGLGTTLDVILSNGTVKEGDEIAVCGINGPIVTTVRALLVPQPLKELRVKSKYIHLKEVRAAQGVKIVAQNLEGTVAGSSLFVVDGNREQLEEEVMKDIKNLLAKKTSDRGVFVQASTLGSLEALLEFLKHSKIPVAGISIGPVHKKDVLRASTMLEHNKKFATILAFDVKVVHDATILAKEVGVKIISADIIYHLFDRYVEYKTYLREEAKQNLVGEIVWPCVVEVILQINNKNPIIVGVEVKRGELRIGTPLALDKERTLGRVTSIEANNKKLLSAKVGDKVAVKLEGDKHFVFGRQFDKGDKLYSKITRKSLDILKKKFAEEITKEDLNLLIFLRDRVFKVGRE